MNASYSNISHQTHQYQTVGIQIPENKLATKLNGSKNTHCTKIYGSEDHRYLWNRHCPLGL